jgi:PTH1 family peptidyl-tRNA hydrolase
LETGRHFIPMDTPVLVVGLGNPGAEYRETRHNAGAMLAEMLAEKLGASWRMEGKFFSELAIGRFGGWRVIVCKPQTYMNLSGEAVSAVSRFYRIPPDRVMVAADDADLPLGTIRMKPSGGAGGHNGLVSMISHLGTQNFPRIKIGIARPEQKVRDIAGHVLGNFSPEERQNMGKTLHRAGLQLECWLKEGLQKAMSLYNGAADEAAPRK